MSERPDLTLAQLIEQIAEQAATLVLAQLREEVQPPPRWMTIKQAAAYSTFTEQHIYDMRSDGRLGRYGEHGHSLVDRYELDAYLETPRGR